MGKSTLAYHFINYVLSKNEKYKYDIDKFEIDHQSHSYLTILNETNLILLLLIFLQKKNLLILVKLEN